MRLNDGLARRLSVENESQHFRAALETAIRIGDDTDTDTVAAIAGALPGARWGASMIPAQWRQILHGYPGRRGEDLVEAAQPAVSGPGDRACGDPVLGECRTWPVLRVDYSAAIAGRTTIEPSTFCTISIATSD
ncbi:ADP-ribosylglycohydrolase family protein [Gordonia caeni]|uniref:ADP-ribosylglycohydrolase family protein n=1 Tax=Gordonia caeni TaxID=1007097 RepID=A0ABP7PID7_9ACTN